MLTRIEGVRQDEELQSITAYAKVAPATSHLGRTGPTLLRRHMSALLVVILVATGEAAHPATVGAAAAARELLGAALDVEVREMDVIPSDDRAQSLGTALHAAAVVELAWDFPAHRQVRIRFHLDRRPGTPDRLILFDEGDDVAERGRTVGYAIASMMTAPAAEPIRPAAPARPEVGPPVRPFARAESAAKPRTRGAVDVVAAGAMGVDGPAGGWGGSLSGRWYFATPWAARLGASARGGQVTEAQSTSLLIHAAAGVAWVPFPATRTTAFEWGARVDVLLMREQLTHFDSDDVVPVTSMRWLPGADAAVEGSWLFSPNAGFLGSFGAEFAFGRTDVTMHLEKVASIPPVRLVLQAGVRATF